MFSEVRSGYYKIIAEDGKVASWFVCELSPRFPHKDKRGHEMRVKEALFEIVRGHWRQMSIAEFGRDHVLMSEEVYGIDNALEQDILHEDAVHLREGRAYLPINGFAYHVSRVAATLPELRYKCPVKSLALVINDDELTLQYKSSAASSASATKGRIHRTFAVPGFG